MKTGFICSKSYKEIPAFNTRNAALMTGSKAHTKPIIFYHERESIVDAELTWMNLTLAIFRFYFLFTTKVVHAVPVQRPPREKTIRACESQRNCADYFLK